MILSLRALYKLPLRQTEGFIRGLFHSMGIGLPIPSFSCLSRRASSLDIPIEIFNEQSGPLHLVADATGLKVFGEGEWKNRIHGKTKRRTWKKVHISMDPRTFQIQSIQMTDSNVVDGKAFPCLLENLENLGNVYADAAYMSKNCFDEIAKRGGKAFIDLQTGTCLAKETEKTSEGLKERNRIVNEMHDYGGKIRWKRESGYSKRNLAETQMFRWKQTFGPKLLSKKYENQNAETKIKANVLNKLTSLGMPKTKAYVA